MAEYEVLVIDTSVPEIRAPGAGDTYGFPRDARFGDNISAYWGATNPLQIYGTGTYDYIDATGRLYVRGVGGNDIVIQQTVTGPGVVTVFQALASTGAGLIAYQGSTKIITTNTGVDVTGNIGVTGTVDGVDLSTLGTAAAPLWMTINADANWITVDSSENATFTGSIAAAGATFSSTVTLNDNIRINFGTDGDYFMDHTSATPRFRFRSSDVDGIGTDGTVFYVDDGTDDVVFIGNIIKSGGTSSQFLKADGSVDSSTYLTSVSPSGSPFWMTINADANWITVDSSENATFTGTVSTPTLTTAASFLDVDAEILVGPDNTGDVDAAPLQVGSTADANVLSAHRFNTGTAGARLSLTHSNNATYDTYTTGSATGHFLGEVLFRGSDTTTLGTGARIAGEVGSTWTVSNYETDIIFQTVASGSTTLNEAMRIGGDGNTTFAGDVNIQGTTGSYIGVADTDRGILNLLGGGATETGGTLRLYNAADTDTTDDTWSIYSAATTGDLAFAQNVSGSVFRLHQDNTASFYGTVKPSADSSHDLGTSSLYWANAYIDTVYTGASTTLTSSSLYMTADGGSFVLAGSTDSSNRIRQQLSASTSLGVHPDWKLESTEDSFVSSREVIWYDGSDNRIYFLDSAFYITAVGSIVSGNITVSSTAPRIEFWESDGTYSTTSWSVYRDSDDLSIRYNNATPYAFLSVPASSTTLSYTQLSGGGSAAALKINADDTVDIVGSVTITDTIDVDDRINVNPSTGTSHTQIYFEPNATGTSGLTFNRASVYEGQVQSTGVAFSIGSTLATDIGTYSTTDLILKTNNTTAVTFDGSTQASTFTGALNVTYTAADIATFGSSNYKVVISPNTGTTVINSANVNENAYLYIYRTNGAGSGLAIDMDDDDEAINAGNNAYAIRIRTQDTPSSMSNANTVFHVGADGHTYINYGATYSGGGSTITQPFLAVNGNGWFNGDIEVAGTTYGGIGAFTGTMATNYATRGVYLGLTTGDDPQIQLQGDATGNFPHIDWTDIASDDYEVRQMLNGATFQFLGPGITQFSFDANVDFAAGIDVTGNITVTGTVDGIDLATNAAVKNASNTFTADQYCTGDFVAGSGSGSIALTVNDGYGNANLTFNHQNGTPDTTGSSCRIETSVDSATGSFSFEIGDSTTVSTPVSLTQVAYWTTSYARFTVPIFLPDQADATTDVTGYGQLWCEDNGNIIGAESLMYTSSNGIDVALTGVRYITFVLVDKDTSVATGTKIGGDFTLPFAGTLLQSDSYKDACAAYTDTAGTTGTMVVDVNKNGTTVMTTNKLDIETGEKDTTTATTQPDLTTTTFAAGDIITFDIDAVHTTAAKGLKVTLAFKEVV